MLQTLKINIIFLGIEPMTLELVAPCPTSWATANRRHITPCVCSWSPLSVVLVSWVRTKIQMTDSWIPSTTAACGISSGMPPSLVKNPVMFMRLSTKLHSRLNGWPQHPTSISFMRKQMPFRKAMHVWTRTYVCSYVCICTTRSSCGSPLLSAHSSRPKSPSREHRDMVHQRLLTDPSQLPRDAHHQFIFVCQSLQLLKILWPKLNQNVLSKICW